jgi:aminoglycoside/choline kinase family phosphotransferase
MCQRLNVLQDWLQTDLGIHAPQLVTITNDASFRRYFRVAVNGVSHIVMDAPPDKEDCGPFIDVAQRLRKSGLNAPKIIASKISLGFLLLTDFGSQLYLPALTEERVESLYGEALKALEQMQTRTESGGLPLYDHHLLHKEMNLFTDWLLGKHLNISLSEAELAHLERCFELLSSNALAQPQVFVHRDYHSRNLMVVPENNPGILDFQDAVKGPVTYDLVSLLRDCYIAWPRERVNGWAKGYYAQLQPAGILNGVDEAQFLRWFDWMGIQRHLKASGIFARLFHRDGKMGYLKDIPRTLNYIVEVGVDYPELAFLYELVSKRVLPAFSVISYQ